MFRVPCTESTTIYNFRSRKNVVEPRYNEGQRNKQNKRSLYRGFVVSLSLFYYHQINGENIHLAIRYTAATLLFKFLKD